jgi:predicted nucleic acid-binding protein
VSVLYADTSAIVRAYFVDEDDHDELRGLLLEGSEPVLTSELTRIEFASAVTAAFRAGRAEGADELLARFDVDCGDDGVITLLRLDSGRVFPTAHKLVSDHVLRTLDAIHLAVVMTDVTTLAAGEPVELVTRDQRQAASAAALGLAVR